MKSKNGTEYAQNYDIIIKWLAAALRGETLEVLGIKTGRIEEVFGFEPVEIPVKAGRVDVMVRDENGALFHIEEQRNLKKADMNRFAAYHFLGAKEWGTDLTDIILASGEVWAGKNGKRSVTTKSGKYAPVIIDFTQRDGRKRLEEIREAVRAGDFSSLMELVFLPLYGKEKGTARSDLAEEVLRFESELYKEGKMDASLVAATLILSNRFIDKERLKALWEEIKMLDILEIAREETILENSREMVEEVLKERFKVVADRLSEQIREFRDADVLKRLLRQAVRCRDIQEFEDSLTQMTSETAKERQNKIETVREMLVEVLTERFNEITGRLSERIREIQNADVLKRLHRQAVRCKDIHEFEAALNQ